MKKLFGSLAIMLAVVCMTGCGGKTLTCTMSDSESGLEAKTTVKMTFAENALEKFSMTAEITIPDEYADQKQSFMDYFSDSEDVKVTETKNGFKIEMSGSKEDFDDLDTDIESATYDYLKQYYTEQGYSCK